jgi:hypothetical protein
MTKTYRVEFTAQYNPKPGHREYLAKSKSDAIKMARDYYNRYCKDREDGRMSYKVVEEWE